jgi:pyruvate/2-oxoglutarate dehydrogenase complex dihydrolipoamide acyltransferase (E2) component
VNFCSRCGAQVRPDTTYCAACGNRVRDASASTSARSTEGGVATAEMVGRTCPYCRFPLKEGSPIQECSYCHTVHHGDCWRENGGCSVGGCTGAPTQVTQAFATPPPSAYPPPPSAPAPPSAYPPPPSTPAPPPPPGALPPPPPSFDSGGPPGGSARRPLTLIVALVGALALMGGVAAALIASSGGGPKKLAFTPSETTSTETATTESTPSTSTSTETTTTQSTPTPAASENPAVEAVTEHWKKIENHEYGAAWADETSSIGGEESKWVQGQEEVTIESLHYHFRAGEFSGNHATVNIGELKTIDKKYGCRTWTGTYGMVREGGRWLISSAGIEPHPC